MTWYLIHRENGLVEIACKEHGVGHPSQRLTPIARYYDTHGCCGCCTIAEWSEAEQRFCDDTELAKVTIP